MSIAKSLRKAGYLSLGAEGLGKFLKKMRENQQEEEIAKISTDTYNKLKELYTEPPPRFEEQEAPSITNLSKEPKESKEPEIPIGQPEIQILPDYISPEDRITKSRNVLADYLDKISSIKGIDPERVKKEFSFMQQRSELLKPYNKEYKIEQFDPYKPIFRIDKNGNFELISPGKTKPSKLTKIGEYTGNDGIKRFMLMDPESGKTMEIPAQYKTISEGNTETREKETKFNKLPGLGDMLNMIEFGTDENGKAVPRTEEEKEKYRKIALNMAKSMLKPTALFWHENEIKVMWGREDLSYEDYNYEVKKSLERGELTVEDAQDLLAFNIYRAAILNIYDKQPYYQDKIINDLKGETSKDKTSKGKTSKGKTSEGKK